MATATAKKQARTTKSRVTSTAKTTRGSAQKAANQARATAQSAERTARTIVLDSAYATVGLADTAVAYVRTLPMKLNELTVEVPTRVKGLSEETPKVLDQRLTTLRTRAESEFDTLAGRGRSIVSTLQRNANAQEALEQVRNARQQVRTAASEVRRAVFSGQNAVVDAAQTASVAVSAAGKAAEREQYQAMTVEELRDLAAGKDVDGRSDMTKAQLVNALVKA